jgi:hypothetical protein
MQIVNDQDQRPMLRQPTEEFAHRGEDALAKIERIDRAIVGYGGFRKFCRSGSGNSGRLVLRS